MKNNYVDLGEESKAPISAMKLEVLRMLEAKGLEGLYNLKLERSDPMFTQLTSLSKEGVIQKTIRAFTNLKSRIITTAKRILKGLETEPNVKSTDVAGKRICLCVLFLMFTLGLCRHSIGVREGVDSLRDEHCIEAADLARYIECPFKQYRASLVQGERKERVGIDPA